MIVLFVLLYVILLLLCRIQSLLLIHDAVVIGITDIQNFEVQTVVID